jgi:hypothetical protein
MSFHPANNLFRAITKVARDASAPQHDEHVRDYLTDISSRGECVVRMNGQLRLEEYTVIAGERWCFTDKGTAVFAGVE